MRILQVNKFYYPRGGADIYFLDLTRALEAAGHEVAVFSMNHPQNLSTPWSRYFVSQVNFNGGNWKDKLRIPGRMLYSLEAKRKFARLVRDFRPDIIHLHNIYHQISPSILDVAKRYHIPVVMHLHDYKLIWPDYTLLSLQPENGRYQPQPYSYCLKNRCVRNSLSASALAVLEMYFHHSILKIYERNVALFIAPSRFMKETVVSFGQPAEKIKVIYNSYDPALLDASTDELQDASQSDYLLYFGRLSAEKGIDVLIRASAATGHKVKIVGSGPAGNDLQQFATTLKAPVEFLGFKNRTELKPILQQAKAVVIPSVWAENMPLSLLEALSLGKIVIASRIGGLPEIIKDGENGLLATPGSDQDLARQIKRLNEINYQAVSRAAQSSAAAFAPAKNLAAVLAVYQNLLKK